LGAGERERRREGLAEIGARRGQATGQSEDPGTPSPGPVLPPTGSASLDPPAARSFAGSGALVWAPVLALPLSVWQLRRRGVLRRGSLARERLRTLPPVPWGVWVAGAALVFLAVPLGASCALAAAGIAVPNEGAAQAAGEAVRARGVSALGAYVGALITAVVLVTVIRRRFERAGELGWLGASPRDLWWGMVGLVAALPFVQSVNVACVMLYRVVMDRLPPEVAHTTLEAMKSAPGDPWVRVQVGAAVLAAPIVEEVLYRAMLQTAILQVTGRAWWAIAGASVVFGVSHVGAVQWYAIPTLVMLGAAMGLAYERTKSLGVPIVMHMGFNGLNVALAHIV